MASAVNGVLLVCLWVGLVSFVDSVCPRASSYGFWVEHNNDGRCILKCDDGYEPSGCYVLRYLRSEGKWNHDVPTCERKSLVSGKTVLAVGTGVAAVLATPAVLAGAGFTAAGVAAGSIAAMLQTPFTAAGGWFALSQSAGVVGTALTTKGLVGTVTGAITYATSSSKFSNCEEE
uniref:Sushi domain-containing protein n=1 Tax=Magallana gigas TaxID=29159 RepID=A0A8W8MTK1_MAGGI|nr:interferon alpha-inducible protein 27-like protein 2B [Crassostrea gigas]